GSVSSPAEVKVTDRIPTRMAHLRVPHVSDDQSIIVGEVSQLSEQGMRGTRLLTTALVPLNRLRATLATPSRYTWTMNFGEGHSRARADTPFAILSPTGGVFEALVEKWLEHNLTTMMPQTQLLATYGLHPRFPNDGSIRWDN